MGVHVWEPRGVFSGRFLHECQQRPLMILKDVSLGGGFKDFLFSPLFAEMIQFDEHIFQLDWFNHQLVEGC